MGAIKTDRFRVKLVGRERGRTILELKISETKNREIRRVMARLGHNVKDLNRVAIAGKVTIKGVDVGEHRPLTESEVEMAVPRQFAGFPQRTEGGHPKLVRTKGNGEGTQTDRERRAGSARSAASAKSAGRTSQHQNPGGTPRRTRTPGTQGAASRSSPQRAANAGQAPSAATISAGSDYNAKRRIWTSRNHCPHHRKTHPGISAWR